MFKCLFDIFFSSAGIILLSPFFLVTAILIKLDSPGPVFFRQERIGKDFKPFSIFKFRTMKIDTSKKGSLITVKGDSRVTRTGSILRKAKIDELPQLINILKGDMSFVGPRPELRKYVEMFRKDYEKLLSMRPGITDPASIKYSDEESLLSGSPDWERDYISRILPEKIKLASNYVDSHNIFRDLWLIIKTIFNIK